MQRPRSPILVAGLVTLLTGSTGCALLRDLLASSVRRPSLHFIGARVQSASLEGATLNLRFRVDNPNAIGLRLASIGYGLVLDGRRLARGQTERGLEIAPGGASEVELPLAVRWVESGQALASLFQKREVPWTADGHFGFATPAGELRVPFEESGRLPLPRPPRFGLASARLESLSFSGATLQVVLEVRNDNGFALPPATLDYHLRLAGREVASGRAATPTVAGSGRGQLSLPVRLDFSRGGRALYDLLRSGEVDLGIDGSFQAGALRLPVQATRRVRL